MKFFLKEKFSKKISPISHFIHIFDVELGYEASKRRCEKYGEESTD
jgi:hypothetical protein